MGIFINFCAAPEKDTLPGAKVDAILMNVPYHLKSETKIHDTMKLFKKAEPKYTLVDSGGYQIFSSIEKGNRKVTSDPFLPIIFNDTRINLTPKLVVEAVAKLKPDMMTSLDFPLERPNKDMDLELEFLSKLGYNIEWAEETVQWHEKLCPGVKLYIPIQSFKLDQFTRFYNRIKHLDFYGLSFPARGIKKANVVLFLIKLYQLGIKRVHILGVTEFFHLAIGAFVAKHLFDVASVDSTSWIINSNQHTYMNPVDFSDIPVGEDILFDGSVEVKCGCKWCKGKSFSEIKNLLSPDKIHKLQRHNFWVIDQKAKEMFEHADSVNSLIRYVEMHTEPSKTDRVNELAKYLDVIDNLRDYDIELLQDILIKSEPVSKQNKNTKSKKETNQMDVIYVPKGKAGEYSKLAINCYTGCTHKCRYCFCPQQLRKQKEVFYAGPNPKRNFIERLRKDIEIVKEKGITDEILLNFIGDPYQPAELELKLTRQTIELLIENDLPFTILTKGGTRAIRDFDLLESYPRTRFGTSLVFAEQKYVDLWEPGAASIDDRIKAIQIAHSKGVPTWVSLEPVIDPEQALKVIKMLQPVVRHWKVGKINYKKKLEESVNWKKFYNNVTGLLHSINPDKNYYYIKQSLRKYANS